MRILLPYKCGHKGACYTRQNTVFLSFCSDWTPPPSMSNPPKGLSRGCFPFIYFSPDAFTPSSCSEPTRYTSSDVPPARLWDSVVQGSHRECTSGPRGGRGGPRAADRGPRPRCQPAAGSAAPASLADTPQSQGRERRQSEAGPPAPRVRLRGRESL